MPTGSLPSTGIRPTAPETCAAITAAGHRAVIKPWPLLPVVEGGFTADDFTADTAAGT
jgi:hypothetical protein